MPRFAIAIHGGAGVISKGIPDDRRDAYLEALRSILETGRDALAARRHALDVCEQVTCLLEDDPRFNAGRGSVYCSDGTHELEASIMCGRTIQCGAVAELTTVRNPICLARLVMEQSPHMFLAGHGAERFADQFESIHRVSPDFFDTQHRSGQLRTFLEAHPDAPQQQNANAKYRVIEDARAKDDEAPTGTVGCVALDSHGDLAAATSTGGRTGKWPGRIGDTPIIGAGNYANNRSCAVSATGTGEEFMRHVAGRDIAAMMEYGKMTLTEAANRFVNEVLDDGVGGVIAVSRTGEIAMPFNSTGMFRGAADAGGRLECAIWE